MEWLDQLRRPIVCAPMGGVAGGVLAAAVTAAGGLGTIGCSGAATPEEIARECALARGGDAPGTGAPFGVGVMVWTLGRRPEVLAHALAERPTLVSLSFGDPGPHVAAVQSAGIASCAQVGTLDEARRALDGGVDALVVRGSEGGGHGRGEVGTLPLLQEVLAMSDRPVLAGGGVASARGIAAVLAAGAAGAWVGTPFVACAESLAAPTLKAAVVAAGSDDTVYTRAFDVAQGVPWPREFGGRALANAFSERWAGRVEELEATEAHDADIRTAMLAARRDGDVETAPVWAGQTVGLVDGVRTAAEVMAELARFPDHLAAAARRWG